MTDGEGPCETERDRVAAERDATASERQLRHAEASARADDRELRADSIEANIRLALQVHLEALEANASDRAQNRVQRDAHDDRVDPSITWRRPDTASGWDAAKRDFVDDVSESRDDAREALAVERDRLADDRDLLLRTVIADAATRIAAVLSGLETDEERATRDASDAQRTAAAADRLEAAAARIVVDSPNALADELLRLARVLYRSNDVQQAMIDITDAATRVIKGSESSSVTTRAGDVLTTVASSSDLADEHDQMQYAAGEGPCVEALSTAHVVVSHDLRADERWPTFVASIATMAARSAVSAPIAYEVGSPHGALNNYSTALRGFDDEDVESAQLLAAHLAILLDWTGSISDERARSTELVKAIETRDLIGQAKGILMERDRLTADQAFDVLARVSQRLNRKLRDIAEELTMTGVILHD
jgi:hypothetical protein